MLGASAAQQFFPTEAVISRFVYAGGADPTLHGKTNGDPQKTWQVIGVAAYPRFQSLHGLSNHPADLSRQTMCVCCGAPSQKSSWQRQQSGKLFGNRWPVL